MADKVPQPTKTLIKRIRRVAKALDDRVNDVGMAAAPQWRARANTCWQVAARLEEFVSRGFKVPEDGN